MPSLKIIILAIIAMAVTFFSTCYYLNIIPEVQQLLTEKAQPLINLVTPIYDKWLTLPSWAQRLILGSITIIPSLLATFFAWTKDRAMRKLRETEQQATAQREQLSGKVAIATEQSQSLEEQLENTKEKLKLYENFYNANKQMEQKITAVEQNLPLEIKNIENRLQGDVSHLSSQIKGLAQKIEEAKKVP